MSAGASLDVGGASVALGLYAQLFVSLSATIDIILGLDGTKSLIFFSSPAPSLGVLLTTSSLSAPAFSQANIIGLSGSDSLSSALARLTGLLGLSFKDGILPGVTGLVGGLLG